MRKKLLLGAMTVLVATAAYMGVGEDSPSSQLSGLQLANAEALAEKEIASGSPCYVDPVYDADRPESVVCDIPCKYMPINVSWFPSISYCL